MGRLRWASAILAPGVLLLSASAVWAAPDPATCALRYLAAQQAADGSVGGQAGITADYVFGAAAAGFDPTLLAKSGGSSAVDELGTAIGGSLGNAALVAKTALAAVDARLDPTSLGGHDLLTALDATYSSTTHAYGDAETYTQSLAILALVAASDAGHPVPAAAVSELKAVQDTDGSWDFQGVKDAAGGGDTNSTAVAIEALVAAGTPPGDASITSAVGYLHAQQLGDGGFPYSDTFGPPFSDPDSDANVIQALVAAGEDPTAAAWTKSGHTALTNLLTFQDAANGGITFPGNPGPDAFTTSQVPAGLEQVPFPGRTTWTTGATMPSGVCAAVAPSPSGSARPIATPPATATGGTPGPAPADSGWLPILALLGMAGVTVMARARSRRLPR